MPPKCEKCGADKRRLVSSQGWVEWICPVCDMVKRLTDPPAVAPVAPAPTPVLVGKMRDFAEECLRRIALNPETDGNELHTKDTYQDILKLCKMALAPVATEETQRATTQNDPQGRTIAWQPQPPPKFILKCRMCGHVAGEGEWVGMVGCSKCTPTKDYTVNCAAQPVGTPEPVRAEALSTDLRKCCCSPIHSKNCPLHVEVKQYRCEFVCGSCGATHETSWWGYEKPNFACQAAAPSQGQQTGEGKP